MSNYLHLMSYLICTVNCNTYFSIALLLFSYLILFVLYFTGLLLVYMSGYMIEVTGSWVNVFSVLAVVNVIGVTIFIVLGEAKRVDQPQIISTSCWKQMLPLRDIFVFLYLSFVTNGLKLLNTCVLYHVLESMHLLI